MQLSDRFDPEHYRRVWPRGGYFQLRKYTPDEIGVLGMPAAHVAVLADVGLPEEAAPFLTFADQSLPCPLSAWDFPVAIEDLERFVVVGYDGSVNPVVLDRQRPGFVLLIDREQDTGMHVFNTSVPRFLSSLLAFRDFIDLNNSEPSPATALDALATLLKTVDPEAWHLGSLWSAEIEAQARLLAG
ncbi:SUKH-4 family immunity protein [Streptomyces sp. NPDC050418]|uniref:SUKH-4 family immunity protein n=1 Tax=Streptomyces sp. NPDC050418 TaxID=3365612 RepID=UPI0037886B15